MFTHLHQPFLAEAFWQELRQHRCFRSDRTEHVHADIVPRQLQRQAARHADYAMLGGGVGRDEGTRGNALQGGGIEDRGPAWDFLGGVAKRPGRRPRHAVGSDKIHIDDPLQGLVIDILDSIVGERDAGVIEQRIEFAESLDSKGDRGFVVGRLGMIAAYEDAGIAVFGRNGPAPVLVDIRQHDAGAFRDEAPYAGLAHARCPPGNQGNPIFQAFHFSPPMRK